MQDDLIPPEPGACLECGIRHPPELPHDKNSAYYRFKFHLENGRWPTWDDALSHCTEEMKIQWKASMERSKKSTQALLENEHVPSTSFNRRLH